MQKNSFETEFNALFPHPAPEKTEKWLHLARDLGEVYDEADGEKNGLGLVCDELITKFQLVKEHFGGEIAQILYDNIEFGAILPSELWEAARFIQNGGSPGELSQQADSGMFMGM
ncbi:MAG: hypothetical protein HPY50_03095 [Firmicutes bacterium]|nr:hypothetical protein [Bacillota bacterium]